MRCKFGRKGTAATSTTVLLITAMGLSGCQSSAALRLQYASSADACREFREPVIGIQDKFKEDILQTALFGAAGGAILGVLLGDKDKRGRNALLGAAAGGAAGTAAGYLRAKTNQAKTKEELLAAISTDVSNDGEQIGTMGKTLSDLTSCREKQIDDLRIAVEDGGVDRDEARRKLQGINKQIADDNNLINIVLDSIEERENVYVDATAATEDVERSLVLGQVKDYSPEVSQTVGQYVVLEGANIRSKPTTSSAILGTLGTGTPIEQPKLVMNKEWYQVSYKDNDGYIFHRLIGQSSGRAIVQPAAFKATATPVQKLAIEQRELRSQQEADTAYLKKKAETLEVLLTV